MRNTDIRTVETRKELLLSLPKKTLVDFILMLDKQYWALQNNWETNAVDFF